MVGDLLQGVNTAEEGPRHGFAAVSVTTVIVTERWGERSALGARDFAQPIRWSGCRREALDETIAANEDLMTKTAPDALLAHARSHKARIPFLRRAPLGAKLPEHSVGL